MLVAARPALRLTALSLLLASAAIVPAHAVPVDVPASNGPPTTEVNPMAPEGSRVNNMDNGASMTSGSGTADKNGVSNNNGYTADNEPHGKWTHARGKRPSPEEMAERVESRITTLHAKLHITSDQEGAWGNVAQAMRDSESNVSQLIQERHQNSDGRTAVDDLVSYQKVAQAHADGLAKVAGAFEQLYSQMSDSQRQTADKVFSGYEGHTLVKGKTHKKK